MSFGVCRIGKPEQINLKEPFSPSLQKILLFLLLLSVSTKTCKTSPYPSVLTPLYTCRNSHSKHPIQNCMPSFILLGIVSFTISPLLLKPFASTVAFQLRQAGDSSRSTFSSHQVAFCINVIVVRIVEYIYIHKAKSAHTPNQWEARDREKWERGLDLEFLNKQKHYQEQPCSLFEEIQVSSLFPPVVQGPSAVLLWSGTRQKPQIHKLVYIIL